MFLFELNLEFCRYPEHKNRGPQDFFLSFFCMGTQKLFVMALF